MLMASKPAKILREEEEAMRAASKAMQLEKPVGEDEYQGPAVSFTLLPGSCSLFKLSGQLFLICCRSFFESSLL